MSRLPISRDDVEVGWALCQVPSGPVVPGPVAIGSRMTVTVSTNCPPGTRLIGVRHTHPGGVCWPSPQDVAEARRYGIEILEIEVPGKETCRFKVR